MADTLLAQAIAAHHRGNRPEAEGLYRAVLQTMPEHADACALLGIVVGARGAFDEAIEWVNKAVALDPASGLLHFHRGTVLMAAQKMPEALAALRHALKLTPNVPQIHFNLANGLRAVDDWVTAIAHYREALRLDPKAPPTYNNLALSLIHENAYDEALRLTQQAVALDPAYGDGWLTMSNVAEKLKNYDLALDAAARARDLMPDNQYAWFGYGLALNRFNRDEEAIIAYKNGLALNPRSIDMLDNLAQTYQALNWLGSAEQTFWTAVEAAGQTIKDEETREVDESEYGSRHWHLALVELLRGKYKQGFARYRSRFVEIAELKRLSFPFPLWKGEDLRGKSLLVCDEQGYGDTLMLLRFLPVLRTQGARVILLVHKVLEPLLRDWSGADAVIIHNAVVPPCDYFCSSFDLPHRLGTTVETIPHDVPYLPVLLPDETTLLPAGRFKIGVVWGGSPLHLNDNKRSVPLSLFADLFSLPDIQFYNFNRDLKAGDAEILAPLPIENLVPRLTDFAAAARLIGQMDMVISCDTATAHLAGGLGKQTWVMLPFAPDWRWLTEREDSPWYPTMRLFRQPKAGDWASVVAAVKLALKTQIMNSCPT